MTPVPRAKAARGGDLHWATSEVVLEPIRPPPEANVSERDLLYALEREAREWNTSLSNCSGVPRLRVGVPADSGSARDDGRNIVTLVASSWCPADRRDAEGCYDPGTQAITHVREYDELAEQRRGEIREIDIEINSVNFRWSLDGRVAGTRSLRAVLAHELGHALGLDDSCSRYRDGERAGPRILPPCQASNVDSIMYPDPTQPGRTQVLEPGGDAVTGLCGGSSFVR
jgi:hypothetical protein